MKQHYLVLMAVLFITLAASCGKKTDDKTTMDMAKQDSTAPGRGATPNISVIQSPNSTNGNFKGIQVSGAGATPATNATFNLSNDSNNYNFLYQANYGPSATTDSSKNSGTQGTKTWTEGPNNVTVFWYPQFKAVGGFQPTTWTSFDTVSVVSSTSVNTIVKFKSATQPTSDITITIIGGGGGPH